MNRVLLTIAAMFLAECSALAGGIIGFHYSESGQLGGVYVNRVAAGSPADRAGLRSESRITHVNEKPTPNVQTLLRIFDSLRPGDTVQLTVIDNELGVDLPATKLAVTLVDAKTQFTPFPVDESVKEAIQEVNDVSGTIQRDDKRPSSPVIGIKLNPRRTSDVSLKFIAALSELKTLYIEDFGTQSTRLTGSGFVELTKLPKLKTLSLQESEISLASAKNISVLKQLETLDLSEAKTIEVGALEHLVGKLKLRELILRETSIDDAHFAEIGKATSLQKLDLGRARFNGLKYRQRHLHKEFKELESLSNLKYLDLSYSTFGDDDAHSLAKLTNLEFLDLTYTLITDNALRHLSKLNRLRTLKLNNPKILDSEGLVMDGGQLSFAALEGALKQLTNLRHLEVSGSRFEPSDIRRLSRQLPRTTIMANNQLIMPTEKDPSAP